MRLQMTRILMTRILMTIILVSSLLSACTAIEDHFYPKHVLLATRLERKVAYHIYHVRETSNGKGIEFYVLRKRLQGLPSKGDPEYHRVKLTLRRAELQYFVELCLKESVNAGYEQVFIHFSMPERVTFLDGREGVTARTHVILSVPKEGILRYFEKEERDHETYFVPYFKDYVFVWPPGIPFEGKANHWKASDAGTLDWGD
jgi:hypothetical protein